MSRLQQRYKKEIRPSLKELHKERNIHEIPVLRKIVISMGLAEALKDKNALEKHTKELMLLSGQKPIVTKSKKAISNFKLREGQDIGLKVTLRGERMYHFFEKFCHIVCPRIPDFRGFSRKCDGRGTYNVGIQDQQIFPEINLDEVSRSQGMNFAFVTSAKTDEDCVELLIRMGFPFKSKEKK